ncbi:MAG: radical SAM protein [Marinobacter sp.]|uniref:Radical SAM protein n=1 Tax=Marinobacter nauticus TaxID=2743 RepID=A0A455W432_MARNT|nr:radical SAM protein [Marinobacter sp.]MDX5441931.1 radical SAM protein [Alteromonadaceae bacterium]BBJ04004.1 radical SAM protein [Marinobacter nauticus]MDX5329533.1 radical SAM protein [Marinobacter sp.]MDX5335176.1 radical SAM protein [Marinobacter sp.]MDX5385940.1 radical SAM protein [Marinobacter sp.]
MYSFPIEYVEPVFRPPSEAKSLILPVTNGCSWNQCTFCEMYTQPQKKFRARKPDDIRRDIARAAEAFESVPRVFLADGDAMVLPTRRLLEILADLKQAFPGLRRVSSYCLPRNLAKKSVEELVELREAGLGILYVGMESGDDEVLRRINKGETWESTRSALEKIKQAGLTSSVMVLNGLGGEVLSRQHAINTATLCNETQPDYLSTLVVSFPQGEERFRAGFGDDFVPLSQQGLFEEIRVFLEHLELESTIFRSDHASNYLVLKGTLGRDKQRLLGEVDLAIRDPGAAPLRAEWMRGL